jgi:hypothetical protein
MERVLRTTGARPLAAPEAPRRSEEGPRDPAVAGVDCDSSVLGRQ